MSGGISRGAERRARVRGLVRKEARQALRDPSSVLIAAVLPLILLLLFGYAVTFDPKSFTVGLVVERASPTAGAFAAALAGSRYFEVETARDRRAFADGLASGDLDGIVVLPADLTARAARSESARIQVIVDGSDPNTARLVSGYLERLWAEWLAQGSLGADRVDAPPAVGVRPRFWFNPGVSSRDYLVPGSIAIILTLTGALLTALVVAREWERGTMETLLAAPLGSAELLVGKLLPYFLLGMGSMALSVIAAVFLFDVPLRGSFAVLTGVCAVFMCAALGQGLLISTLSRSQLVAAQVSILSAFLPAFYFSDFVFAVDSMPWPLRIVSYAVPARYLVSSLQTLFLVGDVPRVILADLVGLVLIAGGFLALTARCTRTRLE